MKEPSKSRFFYLLQTNVMDFFRFPVHEPSSEKAKLVWLVKLRWLAIGLFLLLTIPARSFGYLTTEPLSYYIGCIGLLVVFNILTQGYLNDKKLQPAPTTICFHLAVDLFILCFLLFFAGGYTNPFVLLFLLNASLGGILIPNRLSFPFLALAHSLLGALQFQFFAINGFSNINAATVSTAGIYHLMVFSCWFVMRSLGRSLENQHQMRIKAQVKNEKQDRLRAIGALSAGFSHEFASPLNSAKLRIARALKKNLNEDLEEALKAINSCEQVIRQMNASQLDSRDHHFKSVDLKALTLDVIESWKDMNPQANLQFEIETLESMAISPIHYAQILLNLLDNAFEAKPEGTIFFTLKNNNFMADLEIRDQGKGFHPFVIERFGEPFVTTKEHGTGLGLYVTQLFAQSLGGDLNISNHKSGGALVHLTWPLHPGDQK